MIESTIKSVKNILVTNKINSDSAYFDVSNFNVDANDPVDLKRLIEKGKIKQLKKL